MDIVRYLPFSSFATGSIIVSPLEVQGVAVQKLLSRVWIDEEAHHPLIQLKLVMLRVASFIPDAEASTGFVAQVHDRDHTICKVTDSKKTLRAYPGIETEFTHARSKYHTTRPITQ
jgi:hypothetical protein